MKRIKEEDKVRYVADFETASDYEDHTYVWAWALCKCDDLSTEYGTSIKTFMERLETIEDNSVVYFHNLKFDGSFILNYILKTGWEQSQVKSIYSLKDKTFNAFVSDLGMYYSIKLKHNKDHGITILDSAKKIPFSVSKIAKDLGLPEEKGSIDYRQHRDEGGELSELDKDYIRRDVQIVAQALNDMFFSNNYYGMTIGADCLKTYKEIETRFESFFPILKPEVDNFCRKAYKGGVCYVKPGIEEKVIKANGYHYDYNSMYPSVMHSQSGYRYPIGEPEYYKGSYEKDIKRPLYIQHINVSFSLKKNHMPFIQDKMSMVFRPNEYIEYTEEPIELWLTKPDYELFLKQYDILMIEYIDGYKFNDCGNLFDKYIDKFYEMKEQATVEGNKVKRQTAKLFLNNLYGKFATSPSANYEMFDIKDKKLKRSVVIDKKETVYVPVGAFITSYARKELITAIQANYDKFCYCDTDSMALTGPAKNIKVHDTKLGYWKLESRWTEAKFLRQKTYAEKINNEWDIKCSGLPASCKKNMTIDDFYIGAVIPGKLIPKQVEGGVILKETTYEIKELNERL